MSCRRHNESHTKNKNTTSRPVPAFTHPNHQSVFITLLLFSLMSYRRCFWSKNIIISMLLQICLYLIVALSCLPNVLGHEGGSVDDRQYYFKSLSSTPDGINYATAGRTDIPYLQQYCKNLKGPIKGQEGITDNSK